MDTGNPVFEQLDFCHSTEVMDIFNHYAEHSFAAYADQRLPYEFFGKFMEMTKGYPAYAIKVNGKVAGFCFIRAYNPFPAFSRTAEITYFLDEAFSGKGLGKEALTKLEDEARKKGIDTLLASITSLNSGSLGFHLKNGFTECGRLPGIGKKFGQTFDIVWMSKKI